MAILINVGLATCTFGIIAGSSVFLYRLTGVFLDYVGYTRTPTSRRYVNAETHERTGAPTLDSYTSAHVQRALTVARRGDA